MNYTDLDEIEEIEKLCFSIPWPKQAFAKELLNDLAYYQVAVMNNKVVGYMGMWKIIDEGHITNVAVRPEYRDKGIATKLISKMIDVCVSSEINSMTLEVRESNKIAINLYVKFGFYPVGKRPKYYQKPLEDAIIMWKKVQ